MSKLKMPPGCVDVTACGYAITVVGVGLGRDGYNIPIKRTAFHESGHSVVGRILGFACGGASTADGTGSATVPGVLSLHWDLTRGQDILSSVLVKLMVCSAGPEAERIVFGDADARGDMPQIKELCVRYFISNDDVERLRSQVHALLTKHWRSVEVVAEALMARRTLAGSEIDALCAAAVA